MRGDTGYAYDYASSPTWRYDELNNSGSTKWGQDYQYDTLHRLAKAEHGEISNWSTTPTITADKTWVWDGSQGGNTYSLDQVGNWKKYYNNGTDDERTHSTANEMTARTVGGTAKNPSNDLAGNMTDDGDACLFTYDYRNRIVDVKRKADSSLKARYSYDGKDRRVRKIIFDTNGTTELSDTWNIFDGWRTIEERNHNDSDRLAARYIQGGTYIDELIQEDRDNNGNGSFADQGDFNLYACQDRLYNVVALTDTTGSRLERLWYEPYGKQTVRSEGGSEQSTSFFDNPYLFQGQRYCPESGLYNFKRRDYSATFGRFPQRDPIGYADGLNLYEALASKPLATKDPHGLELIWGPGPAKKDDTCVLTVERWQGYSSYWACVRASSSTSITGVAGDSAGVAGMISAWRDPKTVGAAFAAAPVGTVAAGIGAFVLGWNIGGYAEPLASCYAETRTGEGSPNLKTYTNPDGTAGCPAGYSCNEWAYDKPWR